MSSNRMQQSTKAELPDRIRSVTKSKITNTERIKVLNKQGKNALMNATMKKKFFHTLLERKADIMEHAHSLDDCSSTKNLVPNLRLILPETVRTMAAMLKID